MNLNKLFGSIKDFFSPVSKNFKPGKVVIYNYPVKDYPIENVGVLRMRDGMFYADVSFLPKEGALSNNDYVEPGAIKKIFSSPWDIFLIPNNEWSLVHFNKVYVDQLTPETDVDQIPFYQDGSSAVGLVNREKYPVKLILKFSNHVFYRSCPDFIIRARQTQKVWVKSEWHRKTHRSVSKTVDVPNLSGDYRVQLHGSQNDIDKPFYLPIVMEPKSRLILSQPDPIYSGTISLAFLSA
jgi:hypothetical protein